MEFEEYRRELDGLHPSQELQARLNALKEQPVQAAPRLRATPRRRLGGLAAAACLVLCAAVWSGGRMMPGLAAQPDTASLLAEEAAAPRMARTRADAYAPETVLALPREQVLTMTPPPEGWALWLEAAADLLAGDPAALEQLERLAGWLAGD